MVLSDILHIMQFEKNMRGTIPYPQCGKRLDRKISGKKYKNCQEGKAVERRLRQRKKLSDKAALSMGWTK